jgi:hypothetical protein
MCEGWWEVEGWYVNGEAVVDEAVVVYSWQGKVVGLEVVFIQVDVDDQEKR